MGAFRMKPSEQCKKAGLKSLAELAEMTNKPVQTLINWSNESPELFEIVVLGAALKKLIVATGGRNGNKLV